MLLEKWSISIAAKLLRYSPEGRIKIEVIAYAIGVYLNIAATAALALAFGLLSGKLGLTLKAMLLFNLTRFFSGGFHFQSLGVCAILSAALYAALPHLKLSGFGTTALTLLALAIFVLKAPAFDHKTTRLPHRLLPWYKAVSLLLVCSNLFIHSELFAVILAAQAFTLLPVRKGGVDR
ncbi:hypothetical protein HGI30_02740 [Paenibacillus albicereus]|uniref:Accessory regulator AgrB n=1 Tax=Paenibacillus albicereus TaxID=2726185 RepID=A0A6H2GT60_9BACL|nr:accessory gene regulator B family protein [Paenibacillus albicereus]QJC50613.1 hypothetical protein HGI30_02740 [Paenibacillus albicereus]